MAKMTYEELYRKYGRSYMEDDARTGLQKPVFVVGNGEKPFASPVDMGGINRTSIQTSTTPSLESTRFIENARGRVYDAERARIRSLVQSPDDANARRLSIEKSRMDALKAKRAVSGTRPQPPTDPYQAKLTKLENESIKFRAEQEIAAAREAARNAELDKRDQAIAHSMELGQAEIRNQRELFKAEQTVAKQADEIAKMADGAEKAKKEVEFEKTVLGVFNSLASNAAAANATAAKLNSAQQKKIEEAGNAWDTSSPAFQLAYLSRYMDKLGGLGDYMQEVMMTDDKIDIKNLVNKLTPQKDPNGKSVGLSPEQIKEAEAAYETLKKKPHLFESLKLARELFLQEQIGQ